MSVQKRIFCAHFQNDRGDATKIFVDSATGVQYLWHASKVFNAGMGGLTVMLDQNGKPLLYQPPTENNQ